MTELIISYVQLQLKYIITGVSPQILLRTVNDGKLTTNVHTKKLKKILEKKTKLTVLNDHKRQFIRIFIDI